jgi:hypothetical protein
LIELTFLDAWIITEGIHAGVMKEVGDAVDKRRYKNTKTPSKVQCIGIGSWNYTTGKFSFIQSKCTENSTLDHQHLVQQRPTPPPSSFDRLYSTLSVPSLKPTSSIISQNDDHGSVLINSVSPQISQAAGKHEITHKRTRIYRNRATMPNEDSCPLDPNHTHFILLDDTPGENMETAFNELIQRVNCRTDLTIKLRAEIERQASSREIILIGVSSCLVLRLF